jgi:hypothetical protein
MTWKDKLEIGLKPDAPYRKDNLPDQQVRGPEVPAGEGRSPVVPEAADDKTVAPAPIPRPRLPNEEDRKSEGADTADDADVVRPDDASKNPPPAEELP